MREVAVATPRERPILFQGAMVRALLAGTKTQTRRAMKPQPQPNGGAGFVPIRPYRCPDWRWNWVIAATGHGTGDPFPCPYGVPGDRLWVREAFMHEPADYCWEASVSIPSRPASTVYRADFPESQPGEGWKPSIHMPRKLSRILLEITEVRVQRLQEISDADAITEGIETMVEHDRDCRPTGRTLGLMRWPGEEPQWGSPQDAYAALWESINGAGSWALNPWVFAISFRRINAS